MKTWRYGWLVGCACLLVLGMGAGGRPAIANMANPEYFGDFVGEPLGNVAALDVLQEELQFDLRPLADQGLAKIQARYQIQNDGAATAVDLLFVAPGLETGQVSLDGGSPLAAVPTAVPALPEEWQMPYSTATTSGLQFTVPLPAGEHVIEVQYTASPYENDRDIYRVYRVDYLLAPAKVWQSFGTLTIAVDAPPHWGTDFSIALPQVARGQWQATFTGLPADVVSLSVFPQLPWPLVGLRTACWLGGWGLAIAGCGWGWRWLGRRSHQQQWSGGWLVLAFIVLLPLTVALFWGFLALGAWTSALLLDSRHLAVGFAYRRTLLFLAEALIGGAIALPAAILGFVWGRRLPEKTSG